VLGADTYPETKNQIILSNMITLLGIAVFSTIIGGASSLVANLDSAKEERKREKEAVIAYLRANKVGSLANGSLTAL
jgi:hypothetical protein